MFANLMKKARDLRIPIVWEVRSAKLTDRREASKEVFVVLVFSLMPLWLGMLIINVVQLGSGTGLFLHDFASSSDLGILSAALLGPLIYMIFREYVPTNEVTGLSRFPSGLWFIVLIIVCCVIATMIYCFVYVSKARTFFDSNHAPISFVNHDFIASLSWFVFILSVLLVLSATVIRNSMETRVRATAREMSEDTNRFVHEYQEEQAQEQAAAGVPPGLNADVNALAAALQGAPLQEGEGGNGH